MRLLIVEDEVTLNKTMVDGLTDEGYLVDTVENLADAEYFVEVRHYDLVVVDWMLSDGSGLDIAKNIKKRFGRTAVVVLSARDDKESILQAFDVGIDDYITKPFDFDIFMAKIKARLRFGGSNCIVIDELVIDPDDEKITFQGKEAELKGKPFEVLSHLARHRDQIVSKEQLLDSIWEEPELVTPNVIEVAINQIRQKMDKPLGISTIETVRRRGYRFSFDNLDDEDEDEDE